MTRDDLELYVMGLYEGDVAALERELAGDEPGRAIVAGEARLELMLREAAAAATFCAACDDLVRGARCDACGAAVRPGGYVIERVLVSNAHGRMYAARDADGKQVALKELAFVQSPTLSAIAAFEREAKFLRTLEHPAIPRFCASFEEGTGVHARYYLAQDLVAGEALDARLEDHWFTQAEIVGIARQVLDVLVYLQGLSPMVIHRDIKPANLLVRSDGTIAVVDFGAAHVQGMTAGSTTIGTFGYMPLEQLAGEVDATTDLYALGASLLHLLTRREPWRVLQGVTLDGVELNVTRPMRAFLAKLVAPNPRDRFRSAVEARAALVRVEGGRRSVRSALRWTPLPAMLAAAAVVLAVSGGGGYALWSASRSRSHDDERAWSAMERARDAAARAQAELSLAELSTLANDACRCTDRECAEAASERISSWGRDMANVRWDGPNGSIRPEAMKQLGALSKRMTACLARVMTEQAMAALGHDGHGAMPIDEGSHAHAGPGDGAVVWLPHGGTSIHDAARAIAGSCGVNVVVPGSIIRDVGRDVGARVPCARALDTVLRPTDLAYERDDDIARIARRSDLVVEHTARDNRARRGIADDRLPAAGEVDLDLTQAPVSDVIEMLTRPARIQLVLPKSIDRTVTVHVAHAAWDRVLVAILEASELGYRYRAAGNQLRIASVEEIDALRERETPSGHLELHYRSPARIQIDGVETDWPAGKPLALSPGTHHVTISKPNGARSTYRAEITRGATTRIED